ncbi:MAG TPA: carbohydrate ABC transporter permease [Egibacteraceae bacterium]|nr:carbohydrate ABC transporter permease [Egibacteraceae bacterium]
MRGSTAGRHLPAVLAAAFGLLPLWFMLAGSLRPVGLPPPAGVELWPRDPTLDSFRRLPQLLPLWTYLANSALVTAIAVPLTVLVASWAGFGIRLLAPRARRWVIGASLVILMIPVTAVWATRFEVFRLAGAIDTYIPLVAPALAATSPFYVLIYAWAFGGVGDSQLHAARLEGVSTWRIWRSIVMPQARTATLAVVVLSFAFHWANFIDALLYLNSQARFTLPLGVRFLQLLNPTDWPLLMAGALVMTLPAVVVFLFAQRLFLDDPLRGLRGGRS